MIDQVLLSSQATFIPPCRGRITSLCACACSGLGRMWICKSPSQTYAPNPMLAGTCQNSRALVVGTSKGNLYIVRVETQQILERKYANCCVIMLLGFSQNKKSALMPINLMPVSNIRQESGRTGDIPFLKWRSKRQQK